MKKVYDEKLLAKYIASIMVCDRIERYPDGISYITEEYYFHKFTGGKSNGMVVYHDIKRGERRENNLSLVWRYLDSGVIYPE